MAASMRVRTGLVEKRGGQKGRSPSVMEGTRPFGTGRRPFGFDGHARKSRTASEEAAISRNEAARKRERGATRRRQGGCPAEGAPRGRPRRQMPEPPSCGRRLGKALCEHVLAESQRPAREAARLRRRRCCSFRRRSAKVKGWAVDRGEDEWV